MGWKQDGTSSTVEMSLHIISHPWTDLRRKSGVLVLCDEEILPYKEVSLWSLSFESHKETRHKVTLVGYFSTFPLLLCYLDVELNVISKASFFRG